MIYNRASADLTEGEFIELTNNVDDYTIENEYYKVVIPKPSAGAAVGVVRQLFIRKSDSSWSDDLIYQGNPNYCLGYLEGGNSSSSNNNSSYGMQNSVATTVSVTEETASRIVITSTYDNGFTDFSEIWTFWAKKPYFQSEASIIAKSTYQTNQFQMAWMVNSDLPISWYGSDENGDVDTYSTREMQQIHSPNVDAFPWLNWQFTGEGVSLGMIFTDINSQYTTIGETGDMPFEYQLNFQLGSGSGGNPVTDGYGRMVTTLYYTADSNSNTDIQNLAENSFVNAPTSTTAEPIFQAAATATNAYSQNSGVSSTLVNSPYFLLRQNAQNRHTGIEWPQYATTIYAPLYKYWDVITTGSYDFKNQLEYTLNYANDDTTYTYGTISSAVASNSLTETSLQHDASSSDGVLDYVTSFTTWSDSDKLQITGTTSNGSPSAPVKDIYLSLAPAYTFSFEAETAIPTESITNDLVNNDNLWTAYLLYGFDSGSTLIYRDNGEDVSPLSIPISLPDGSYSVKAYVNQRTEGSITYRYSLNGTDYSSFVVEAGGVAGSYEADLGVLTVNGSFYIDDDNSLTGIAGYGGWDRIVLTPTFVSLGSNIYDLPISDDIYGTVGIAVKVNSPTDNIVNGEDLRVYTYKEPSEQTLTTFSYDFDIEVYPHTGSLGSADDFTALRTQNLLEYTKHNFYLPQKIHTGRTNTVFPDGIITYSTDPYNEDSEIDLTILPTGGAVSVAIDTWNTAGTYYKKWTEDSITPSTTTSHTVGSLVTGTSYDIVVDGESIGEEVANVNGEISFNYTGGYSTKVFEVSETEEATVSSADVEPMPDSETNDNLNGSVSSLDSDNDAAPIISNTLDDVTDKKVAVTPPLAPQKSETPTTGNVGQYNWLLVGGVLLVLFLMGLIILPKRLSTDVRANRSSSNQGIDTIGTGPTLS